ncbi:MAG: hypothetical protein KGI54_14235 [Pseudomonadota bacterium]|nr:hypothetical protein [Pseudomonadota bacterium]
MANVIRVNGFKPVKHLDGSPWNGQTEKFATAAGDATPIFIGDLVKLAATGEAATGIRTVTKAAVGDAVIGAVVGIMIDPTNLNTPQYRKASVAQYVFVSTAPDTVYEANVNGAFTSTTVGQNANHIDAGGSTSTGASGESVDATTIAITATLTLKIYDAVQRVDNDPTLANSRLLVSINNHQLASGTGTAGV